MHYPRNLYRNLRSNLLLACRRPPGATFLAHETLSLRWTQNTPVSECKLRLTVYALPSASGSDCYSHENGELLGKEPTKTYGKRGMFFASSCRALLEVTPQEASASCRAEQLQKHNVNAVYLNAAISERYPTMSGFRQLLNSFNPSIHKMFGKHRLCI